MAEPRASYPRRESALAGRAGGARALGRRRIAATFDDDAVSRRELAVVTVLLAILAVVAMGSYVLHGGFYSDDWELAAWTKYPAHGGIIGTLREFQPIRYRPGQYLYDPLIHTVLGMHVRAFLAWSVLCAVAMSSALYLFLRYFTIGKVESAACAALVLVFPYSSSTRLWSTSCVLSITVVLYLVGTLISLEALRGRWRRFWPMRILGLVVTLLGVMMYEVVAPTAVLAFVLYLTVTTRRRALLHGAIDAVVIVATLVLVTSGRNQPIGTLGDQLHHAHVILQQSQDLFTRILVPYGVIPQRLALGFLLVVAATAAIVAWSLPRANRTRTELLRYLVLLAAGVAVAALGYAMYVPADLYYSPDALGIGDRTNGYSAVGWVMIVVALARLLATLVFRELPRARLATALGVGVLALLVGLGYTQRLQTEADAYVLSWKDQQQILGTMRQTLPVPKHYSTIFLVRNVPWTAPGVPVFVQPWELQGTVKVFYADRTLNGYPIPAPGVMLACGPTSISIVPTPYGPPVPYGQAYITDMGGMTTTLITNRATCLRVTRATGSAPPATA